MNRKMSGCVGAVLTALLLTACGVPGTTPGPQQSGVLEVAYQQHPPYSVVDGSSLSGPNFDLARAIAERLGLQPNFTEVAHGLAPVLAGIKSDRYDIFMGPIQTTPDRAKDFDLVGWATSRTNYLVDKAVIEGEDATSLCGGSIAFVDASQVGTQVDDLSTWCVGKGAGAVTPMPLADTNATLLAVKSGRAIAAGTTAGAAQYTIDADNAFTRLPQPEEASGTRNNQGLVLPKDAELTPRVLEVLEGMFDDGSYLQIMEHYRLQDLAPERPVLNPPLLAD
ncbi:transporter substrate-binding domain-containing protein [Pseudonocardia sp. DLS-67]